MRFTIGMVGGIICSLFVAGAVSIVSYWLGRGASQPFTLASELILAFRQGLQGPLAGFIIYLVLGGLFGGFFTSVMCGRVATGPAIGIGLVYGFGMYVALRFAVVPILDPDVSANLSSTTLLGRSLLFGALMGVWTITVSHLWPRLAIKCD